jgi:hypothetical protein
MNMQTIQILFLLIHGLIKLAPWRIVTDAMDRIGYGASESLARVLGVMAVSCAGLGALSAAPVIGPLLLTGYLGAMVWGGLWLRGRNCGHGCRCGADLFRRQLQKQEGELRV